jgi:hypothetical protein
MRIRALLVCSLLALALALSVASEIPGMAPCQDVSGSWKITDHCEEEMIGDIVNVFQSECEIESEWGADNLSFDGTIDEDSHVIMTGTPDEEEMTCEGSVKDDKWTMDCTPGDCHVELEKDD